MFSLLNVVSIYGWISYAIRMGGCECLFLGVQHWYRSGEYGDLHMRLDPTNLSMVVYDKMSQYMRQTYFDIITKSLSVYFSHLIFLLFIYTPPRSYTTCLLSTAATSVMVQPTKSRHSQQSYDKTTLVTAQLSDKTTAELRKLRRRIKNFKEV